MPALPSVGTRLRDPLLAAGVIPVQFFCSNGCVITGRIAYSLCTRLIFVLLGAQNAPVSASPGKNRSLADAHPNVFPAIRHARSDRVIPRVAFFANSKRPVDTDIAVTPTITVRITCLRVPKPSVVFSV